MRFSPHCKSLPIKGDSGQNDSVDHNISRPHQYLQHHPDKFTSGRKEILKLNSGNEIFIILPLIGGGSDGDGGVGDCLYCLCLCGPYGVSHHMFSLSLSVPPPDIELSHVFFVFVSVFVCTVPIE